MVRKTFIPLQRLGIAALILSSLALSRGASAATPQCKEGFKRGKTPLSLVAGAKPGCVSTTQAAVGKKLLNGTNKACYICHSATAPYPPKQMISNLREQGYTLKSADILASFNAHFSEMSGGPITSKEAKAISNYLQSIK